MKTNQCYPGIDHDQHGGMTDIGRIIRDAWLAGWSYAQIDQLYDQVTAAWHAYGHLVSNLPDDLRARHTKIYARAVKLARDHGWDPELNDGD